MKNELDIGAKVRVTRAPSTKKVYTVGGIEEHFGRVFYSLREVEGALFLRTSLELVRA